MTGFGSRDFHFDFSDLNPDQISLVGTPVAIMATGCHGGLRAVSRSKLLSIAYLPLLKF